MKTSVKFETIFPLTTAPLIQCITNEITCESMANALLYIDAKPIMADDPREFPQLFQQTSALVLNLGHLSQEREQSLLAASDYARQVTKPTVVDLVGYGASRGKAGAQSANRCERESFRNADFLPVGESWSRSRWQPFGSK